MQSMMNWSKKPTYRFNEAIRIQDGQACFLEYHAKRILRSLSLLAATPLGRDPKQLEVNLSDEIRASIETRLHAEDSEKAYERKKLRLLWDWSVEEGLFAYIDAIDPYLPNVPKAFAIIPNVHFDYRHKYCDRSTIQQLCAGLPSGVEAIFIAADGRILESNRANLALLMDGRWLSPMNPLHEGTARERYLAQGKIETADLRVEDLQHCDAVMLLNAMLDWGEALVKKPFLLSKS